VADDRHETFISFDDPAACRGQIRIAPPGSEELHQACFYEALRIGQPEALERYLADCRRAKMWSGEPPSS
jgi:hypothetical protein